MTTWTMRQTVDLERGAKPRDWLTFCLTAGDAGAHAWQVTVTRGGEAATEVPGATTAYYIRQDGKTVVGPARAEGGVVTAVLPAEAYRTPGALYGILRASDGEQVTTLAAARWIVTAGPTDTLVDPEDVVPSLDALLARLEETAAAASDARLAASEARQGAKEVRQAMEEVRQNAEETRQSVEEVRQNAEETRQGMEEVRQSVEEVRQAMEDCYPVFIQRDEPAGRCVWIKPVGAQEPYSLVIETAATTTGDKRIEIEGLPQRDVTNAVDTEEELTGRTHLYELL